MTHSMNLRDFLLRTATLGIAILCLFVAPLSAQIDAEAQKKESEIPFALDEREASAAASELGVADLRVVATPEGKKVRLLDTVGAEGPQLSSGVVGDQHGAAVG